MLLSLDKYYSAGKQVKISTGALKLGLIAGNLRCFLIIRNKFPSSQSQDISTYPISYSGRWICVPLHFGQWPGGVNFLRYWNVNPQSRQHAGITVRFFPIALTDWAMCSRWGYSSRSWMCNSCDSSLTPKGSSLRSSVICCLIVFTDSVFERRHT